METDFTVESIEAYDDDDDDNNEIQVYTDTGSTDTDNNLEVNTVVYNVNNNNNNTNSSTISTKCAEEYDNDNDVSDPLSSLANGCDHLDTVKEEGSIVCCKCGLRLSDTLIDTEQRYYTPGDSTTINRHHTRKSDARSLYGDLEKHGFPKPIMELSNTYYIQIINGQIYRAKMRTAIVFACVFNAFKALKEPRSPEEIAKIFGLDKKGISRGLKLFSSFFKGRIGNDHITALHLVPKLLADLNINNPLILEDLTKLFEFVERSSQLYKSSAPQSVAAGLIWYYLKRAKIAVTKQQFTKVVGLTDITFTKLADETAYRLGEQKVKAKKDV